MIQVIKQKEGNTKLITTVLTGHSFKYRRLLDGANVEDVQTDKHIPYEQNELQQTYRKVRFEEVRVIKRK